MACEALFRALQNKTKATRAATDLEYLSRLVMEPKHLPLPPHLIRIAQIIRDNQKRDMPTLILAAVGHLKSTTIGLLMVQDLLGPDPHILLGSQSYDVVAVTSNFLRNAIQGILGKERVDRSIKSVPGFAWQTEKFMTPTWRPATKFPSFYGLTLGKNVEGMRGGGQPAVAYLDDPVDRKSQTSKAARKDAREWYTGTYQKRLAKGTVISCIGSPWHPEDFYTSLVRDGFDTHCFPMYRYPCPRLYAAYKNVTWHGEEYDWLWDLEWAGTDKDVLERREGGSIPFRQRRLVDPEAIRGSRFKAEWFTWFDRLHPTVRARLVIYMGVDPATGKQDIGDLTAIVIIGYDEVDNIVYVLRCAAGWWDPVKTQEKIILLANEYQPDRILIEDTSFQLALIRQLQLDTQLPVMGQGTEGRDKVARIDTLAVPIKSKRLVFCSADPEQQDLVTELLDFPNSDDDDRADALEIATREVFAFRGQVEQPGTAADIVSQAVLQDLHKPHQGREW